MLLIKITNLKNEVSGVLDYKGLDINQFIGGSQIYDKDLTYCILATNESIKSSNLSNDVTFLTEQEYIAEKELINSKKKEETKSLYEENEELKQRLDATEDALLALLMGGEV